MSAMNASRRMMSCVLGVALLAGSAVVTAPAAAGAAPLERSAATAVSAQSDEPNPVRATQFTADGRFQASISREAVESGARFVFWIDGEYVGDLQGNVVHGGTKTDYTSGAGGSWVTIDARPDPGETMQIGFAGQQSAVVITEVQYFPRPQYTDDAHPLALTELASGRVTGVAGTHEKVDVTWETPDGAAYGSGTINADPVTGEFTVLPSNDIAPGSTVIVTAYDPKKHTPTSHVKELFTPGRIVPRPRLSSQESPIVVTSVTANSVSGYAGTGEKVHGTSYPPNWGAVEGTRRFRVDPVTGAFTITFERPFPPGTEIMIDSLDARLENRTDTLYVTYEG